MKNEKLVKIDPEAHKTLRRLSDLSGMDGNALIEEWLKGCQAVLDGFEHRDYQKISMMSARNPKDNVVVTYIGRLFVGRLPLSIEESQMEKDVDPEIFEGNKKKVKTIE
jgi:hypothetical protein